MEVLSGDNLRGRKELQFASKKSLRISAEVSLFQTHLCVIHELDIPQTFHTHDDLHGPGLGLAVGVFVRIAASVS